MNELKRLWRELQFVTDPEKYESMLEATYQLAYSLKISTQKIAELLNENSSRTDNN